MREEFGFGDALIASDGHDVNRVFYTGTCTDAVDAAAQCLSAGMDQDLGGMSYGKSKKINKKNQFIGPECARGHCH